LSQQISSLIIERSGKILKLRLNRPEKGNALDPQTLLALHKAVMEAQTDAKVKVLQLTGTGTKDFCTGIDVTAASALSPANRLNIANIAGDIATLLYFGKPAVVGLNGRSMGMGVVFAVAADYRIIRDGVELRMPEINAGIFPGASCMALMSRVCGIAWTRRILMTGEPFSCEDALAAGIVDEVEAPEEFETRLDTITHDLARKNNILLKAVKFAAVRGLDVPYNEILSLEQELAQYYSWADEQIVFEKMAEKYQTTRKLTGDPDMLLKELENQKK
jgi:enoyl-CoA hydratase/carnithine racemase